ncbi:TolC family protein [Flavihumibacter fluvii]|uniref:TolC family protein n=1 Tax=Flavihumibacter fluvii TaxID=2838157 RepID=UPI001BDE199F|nr:TolC family protein [Flavihumibacter fluvii]ULQ53449.1 TolC family protein [Flavihumibacter fluvii]
MKHYLKITTCIGVVLATFSYPLLAQENKALTLDQAVELSLKNSKQVKLNQAKINEANALLKQAEDSRLPEAGVSGSALWLPTPSITLDESLKNNNSGGGAQQPIKVNSALYGMLNVSQPLFTGFKIKSGIESARYLAIAARLDSEHDRNAIIENTIQAYTNLYKADAAISVVKETLAESNQRVKDYSSLEKNGVLARNDLLKAQLEVSNLELALLEAEKDRKLANVNMNIMLGLPTDTSFKTSLPEGIRVADKPLEEWENIASQNRKDMAALKEREKAGSAAIVAARSDLYPGIAATAGYVAANIPGLMRIDLAVNVGIGVKYNISSIWKTKAKVSQAEARQQQIQISQGLLNDNISLQLNKDYQDAILADKRITVLEKAVDQANENYRIVSNKFRNSIATTQEVLDANVARLRAQLNYEFSKADAQVSNYKLAETAGIISQNFTSSK